MSGSFSGVLAALLLVLLLVSLPASKGLATPLSADMIVSVPDQELALVDRGKVIVRYFISTSKFGTGDPMPAIARRWARYSFQQKSVTGCLRAQSSRMEFRPVKSLPWMRRVGTRSFHE
jgi:hypothetical protein